VAAVAAITTRTKRRFATVSGFKFQVSGFRFQVSGAKPCFRFDLRSSLVVTRQNSNKFGYGLAAPRLQVSSSRYMGLEPEAGSLYLKHETVERPMKHETNFLIL
jgi:hypothetical protein